MKIDVVVGNNFKDVNQTAIKMIDVQNFNLHNFIIVPDRFSLLMEKLIFETLGISSTINIFVMGISRLATQIFQKLGKDYEVVSKQESLLILRSAIIKLKSQLKFFKNSEVSIGLCEELFETMSQLKSNEIKLQDLKKINTSQKNNEKIEKEIKNINEISNCVSAKTFQIDFKEHNSFKSDKIQSDKINFENDKIFDITLIYEEYDKLLKDKIDSTRVLSCLEEAIYENCEELNLINKNFFFLNFDSLTKQGYSILKALATASKNVCVGTLQADFQKNSYIFENDIFEKLQKLSIAEGFELNLITASCSLKAPSLLIHKNLYSLNIDIDEKVDSNFVEVFEAPEISEEIFDVARKISHKIKFENIKFKQIAVACGDLNLYANQIENVFEEFGFAFYLDTSKNLNETLTINFLLLILNMLEKNFPKNLLESFVSNEFTQIPENEKNQFLDIVEKYNLQYDEIFNFFEKELIYDNSKKVRHLCMDKSIGGEKENEAYLNFEELFNKFKKLRTLIKRKDSCNFGRDYINLVHNIVKEFKILEKNSSLLLKFQEHKFFKEEKIYLQIPEKLNQVLTSMEKFLQEQKLSFKEFIELFESYIASIKLSTVPISANSIFVGDATNSFFDEVEFLFVIGANQGLMPRILHDNGIVDDNLIENLSSIIEINPTVKMINRRNRFKIFNLLLQATQKIYISYVLAGENQDKLLPSRFVFDLQKIFNNFATKRLNDYILFFSLCPSNNVEQLCWHLAYYCANKQNAMHQILKYKYQNSLFGKLNHDIIDSLKNFLNSDFLMKKFDFLNELEIDHLIINNLMHSKIAVTQIENYYQCPFKQFASNILKLKEKDVAELTPIDSGNVLHRVAEEFLKPKNEYIKKIKEIENDNTIELIIKKIFKNLQKSNRFYKLNLKINKNAVEILKNESKRLCEFLFYTQTISKFKPTFLELRFGSENYYNEKNVLNSEKNVLNIDCINSFEIENLNSVDNKKSNIKISENLKNAEIANQSAVLKTDNIEIFPTPALSETTNQLKSLIRKNKTLFEKVEINGKKFSLSGVIDRVDVFEDMFIVIDYKSGAENTGGFSEIFYGEKIQIFIYLKVLEKMLNKKPCGAFYFPINNEYQNSTSKSFMMKGKAVENFRFLNSMDTSLGVYNSASKIFPCKINTNKKLLQTGEKEFSKLYTVSEKVLKSIMDYSFCILKSGASEILQGNICPSPRIGACVSCKFSSLCLYGKNQFRNKIYEIRKSFFEDF